MRYAAEFRRAWKDASGVAMDVGKKMLGYLANQKALSGVDSLVQRVVLDDGTLVEARWDGNIPTVRVTPADGSGGGCELYVESGLLDLGPNLSAARFDAGLPTFDASPATLYFGDGVDCTDGLNGAVIVQPGELRSQCLSGVATSRLSDPVKKQAQALIPASTFTGLMQRYVQAVYGGTQLTYSATADALTIQGQSYATDASIGLVDFDGTLAFLAIDGTSLTARALQPVSRCIAIVLDLWAAMPAGQRKDKVLTIALSGCVQGEIIATGTIVTGNRHFTRRAAWAFDTGKRAVAVFEDGGNAAVYTATFSLSGSTVSASVDVGTPAPVGAIDSTLSVVACSPYADAVDSSGFDLAEADNSADYDFPVYASFASDGTTQVVRYSLIAQDALGIDLPACADSLPLTHVIGVPMVSESRTDLQVVSKLARLNVAEGYYGPGWSSVAVVQAIDDDGILRWSLGTQTIGVSEDFTPITSSAATSGEAGGKSIDAGIDCYEAFPNYTLYDDTSAGPCAAHIHTYVDLGLKQTAGPRSYGCAVTFTDEASEVGDDCNTRYNPLWVSATPSLTTDFEHYAFTGFGFDGMARAGAACIASLLWGGQACMAERYSLRAGDGFFWRTEHTTATLPTAVSGTIDREHERYDAWPSRPDLFCKTPEELTALGWTAGDYDTTTVTLTETLTTVQALNEAQDKAVIAPMYTKLDPPTDGAVSLDALRGIDAYTAQAAWGSYAAGGGIVIDEASNAPYTDRYAQGSWGLVEPGLTEALAVGLVVEAAASTLVDTAFSGGTAAWSSAGVGTGYVEGFARLGQTSLLGALLRPTLQAARGNAIGMDRLTLTASYPTVNSPSFVGWA